MRTNRCLLLFALILTAGQTTAQKKAPTPENKPTINEEVFAGLSFRSVGPAFMSGRIADIVIHPEHEHTWYVAVGSGGIWKTVNGGTTWQSVFDGQGSYSLGCLALDPQNPNTVWAGTGENVGGRHVGFGDGVYRSADGGASWEHRGLKTSEHISRIIVHPTDQNTLWVAAQGPLWSKGGERGVYKTTDGGTSWKQVLGDQAWVGATDLLIDPRNPDVLYAATWQRHRTVAGYMGGGPGTAMYTSTNGGESWTKLTNGLPTSNMGKIGLAISPQNADVLYAAIELDRRSGAVYRSNDRGASWSKMSDAVSGGTGPHYYQELYPDPHRFDRIYLADNYMQVSDDGGKTFVRMNENNKHIDNHAVAFKANDPDYLLVGTDGGLYESFDLTKTWRYIANLPVTQFYKIAVDDAQPFYNIYGGTQDNATQGGPSRTDNEHGIANSDWFVTVFGDGHQPATEPGNPNIVYSQWQQGNLVRHDRATGETVYIQPVMRPNEPKERWNWDAPILVSPHNPERLYFASQRVWRSENRGDAWEAVSPDLTRAQERVRTPFFGELQAWDNPWDIYAMSQYGTITSLAESPLREGLLYAGTDDGFIAVSEDAGGTWRKSEINRLPGAPATAFVNDIKADLFNENTVYVALDNHKFGDFKPYLYKSTDRGRTWSSIMANLPDRHLCWRIVQDHVEPNLLFVGTEFGVYTTLDGGKAWYRLTGGMPTIAVRDLAIQRDENDLVAATFGRGIFVIDDYAALREIAAVSDEKAHLFAPRKAWWYLPRNNMGVSGKGFQGDNYYLAENPPFGAVFTYYLEAAFTDLETQRKEQEKELKAQKQTVAFPEWDALDRELSAIKPALWVVIKDGSGLVVNRVEASNKKGLQRVAWNLRTASRGMVTDPNANRTSSASLAPPGAYTAQLVKESEGRQVPLTDEVPFVVEPLRQGTLPSVDPVEAAAWLEQVDRLRADVQALEHQHQKAVDRVELMRKAYDRAPQTDDDWHNRVIDLRDQLITWKATISGSPARRTVRETQSRPTLSDYLSTAYMGAYGNTYGGTETHRQSYAFAEDVFRDLRNELDQLRHIIPELEQRLQELGAPLIEGQELPQR